MKQNSYYKERLHHWADFFCRVQSNLGYPPLSVEGRLMRDGGVLPRGTKSIHDPTPTNAQAEEIEAMWQVLAKENRGRADAVKAKYFSHANVTSRTLAKKLQLPLRTFQRRLEQGEKWFRDELRKKYNI